MADAGRHGNFGFLHSEWSDLHDSALKAESFVYTDPRASCFYSRRSLELAVAWLYKHDSSLHLPYSDQLSALIHEPSFRNSVGPAVFNKARLIKDLGNLAVHSPRPIRQFDALTATKELFHICFWLARTYARGEGPHSSLAFDANAVPRTAPLPPQTLDQLKRLEEQLREKDEKLTELLTLRADHDGQLEQLRAEIAAAKKANSVEADTHDYSEAETRDFFIDLLLKEAGWTLDKLGRDTEFPVTGMPTESGEGFVDYVLWGDDGKPLGLVEAKRTRLSAKKGQRQAELYANCLEKQFGQRPVIFCSNGYTHWLWDDTQHPPREVQGFYKKAELELLIQRRTTRKRLADAPLNATIVERPYQHRAIRRISESFEQYHQRKALLVMATGAGKTRTVVALSDLLMQCNWAKRVLFLADRVALVRQATRAFASHLPSSSSVNLVEERDGQGRVYLSTYPTMMNLIDRAEGQRQFGVGHFDLVVIDEAHRSVYQKYRAIFEYFDSLLVGLTATPRAEIDRDTYGLFDLEKGVPTDAYELEEAVKDGYLVPAKAISVPVKFQREGIKYDDLTQEDKDRWDALEWDEDGTVPDAVSADALNKWLFNADTVDKVLAHLMTNGVKVAGGDRLGKTIIFAKNQDHAEFIAERFDKAYPHLKGSFARIITFQTDYAQSLIDDFSTPESNPHIAISVDMLDTGIDVPEVVNLVFFKAVRSKTKFWQMIGRGTRLRPDLFGPGRDKQHFYVFDYCQNFEWFNQHPKFTDVPVPDSLSTRLFKTRLELLSALDGTYSHRPGYSSTGPVPGLAAERSDDNVTLRRDTADQLHAVVAGMPLENFVVRPHREILERYLKPDAWSRSLTGEQMDELSTHVARLPTTVSDGNEEAKRFDLMMLRLQLAVLHAGTGFTTLRDKVRALASALEEQSNIPMVREQLPLIEEVASEEWWTNVTAPMLEVARKRLRGLVYLIPKAERKIVYTDFEDELGPHAEIILDGLSTTIDLERFTAKAREFLKAHKNHVAVYRLRHNLSLTGSDLEELERMLVEARVGSPEEIAKAKQESQGLGRFIRSLVGLDREAAMALFSAFLQGGTASANQIEFINLIITHLTERGVMDPELLYEAPFTDHAPTGPQALFAPHQLEQLVATLNAINSSAAA